MHLFLSPEAQAWLLSLKTRLTDCPYRGLPLCQLTWEQNEAFLAATGLLIFFFSSPFIDLPLNTPLCHQPRGSRKSHQLLPSLRGGQLAKKPGQLSAGSAPTRQATLWPQTTARAAP